ncbi:MAG TPA: hypothetical protein VI756_09365 [Blastocatellia bacterium]
MLTRTTRLWIARLRTIASMLGVLVLVCLSIRSAYLRLRGSIKVYKAGTPDFVVAYGHRIIGVKSLLPPSGTLGYLSDQSDTGQFFATQYLLSPWAVVNGDQTDWVLVNDHPAGISGQPGNSYTLSVRPDGSKVCDFGNGIMLIDKRASR